MFHLLCLLFLQLSIRAFHQRINERIDDATAFVNVIWEPYIFQITEDQLLNTVVYNGIRASDNVLQVGQPSETQVLAPENGLTKTLGKCIPRD